MSSLLFSSYFSKDSQNPPDEEMEVRRNLESLLEPDRVETAFGSVLAIERSLVGLVDEKSRSSPVVVFRDESNEVGGFVLILELALHQGHPSPLYLSADSCNTLDINQLVKGPFICKTRSRSNYSITQLQFAELR